MTDRRETFEALYDRNSDPWNFETSSYEHEKRRKVIEVLADRFFDHALEIGCSTGVQTAQFALRCKSLLAIDVAQNALEIARERLGRFPHVTVRRAEVPQEWPGGTYDLIFFSEVLYFLSEDEIEAVSRLTKQSLAEGGICVLVNWLGPTDLPISGNLAVELFRSASNLQSVLHRRYDQYRIDVMTHPEVDAR